MIKKLLLGLCFCFVVPVDALSIKEKKANLHKGTSDLSPELDRELAFINKERRSLEHQLKNLYAKTWSLYETQGDEIQEGHFQELLDETRQLKSELNAIDNQWQRLSSTSEEMEPYALWHQPETTLLQLVVDYGSRDFVYLVPPEIGQIKMSLSSDLPIPRSAWGEMLEWILEQNGVLITQLNPYLRKLSLASEDFSTIKRITNDRQELHFLQPKERICFVLNPDIVDIKRAWLFLQKFSNPVSQQLQWHGRDIFIVATVAEVQELLRLYDFALETGGDRAYQLIPLCKVSGEEMAKMLSVLLDECPKKEGECAANSGNGLSIVEMEHMPRALFLVGTPKEIKRAEEIIRKVEGQMCDSKDKEVYWYSCKHSDPEELAQVLAQVYDLMICNYKCYKNASCGPNGEVCPPKMGVGGCNLPGGACGDPNAAIVPPVPFIGDGFFSPGFYSPDGLVVDPVVNGPKGPCNPKKSVNCNRQNFIVDMKTGAIVMVVEQDLLPKIKETIRRLDIPKKMVQIEVMLFEKRTEDQNNFGLSNLKAGAAATGKNVTGLVWNDIAAGPFNKGIFDFFISRASNGWVPAFDMMYKFLISQSDMQINTAPSVLAVNQTEAKISIVDEISINMGAVLVPTIGTAASEKSFVRSQYGIQLSITPTIHAREDRDLFFDDETDYITLKTEVGFDTIQRKGELNQQPDITKRKICNEAIVPDGQSVILGGLKKKITEDNVNKIPFLGDLPCIGKLFSFTEMNDKTTDMFVIITPKIVRDPATELEQIKLDEMCRRPGDMPDYLCRLERALRAERNRLMENTMSICFGRLCDRCHAPGWSNDGNNCHEYR